MSHDDILVEAIVQMVAKYGERGLTRSEVRKGLRLRDEAARDGLTLAVERGRLRGVVRDATKFYVATDDAETQTFWTL